VAGGRGPPPGAPAGGPRPAGPPPPAAAAGYAAGAERHGATVRTHAAVTAVEPHGPRWRVVTTRGTAPPRAVVLCAGAWSRALGAMVDVDLPVEPVKRQIAFTAPLDPPPPRLPFTIDFGTTYYLHNGAGPRTLLLGASDPGTPVAFDTAYDAGWEPFLRGLAARATPSLAGVPLVDGWAGLYELTPDHDALIGEAAATGGGRVLYACGFSGHGFLQAPAVGEAIADLYAGRAGPARRGADVGPFAADRFAADTARHEANII
jgi:sarcosine oxidase, subunit beta